VPSQATDRQRNCSRRDCLIVAGHAPPVAATWISDTHLPQVGEAANLAASQLGAKSLHPPDVAIPSALKPLVSHSTRPGSDASGALSDTARNGAEFAVARYLSHPIRHERPLPLRGSTRRTGHLSAMKEMRNHEDGYCETAG
jgi:hypothetical protein